MILDFGFWILRLQIADCGLEIQSAEGMARSVVDRGDFGIWILDWFGWLNWLRWFDWLNWFGWMKVRGAHSLRLVTRNP
jgi:hypothetical protein